MKILIALALLFAVAVATPTTTVSFVLNFFSDSGIILTSKYS